MPRHASYLPHGVIPAVLLRFNEDSSIHEKSFRAHLRDVAVAKGISALWQRGDANAKTWRSPAARLGLAATLPVAPVSLAGLYDGFRFLSAVRRE